VTSIKVDEPEEVDKASKSSFRRKPESRKYESLQNTWTPVFTGVTTFYDIIKL
jgi:hypothetical protein